MPSPHRRRRLFAAVSTMAIATATVVTACSSSSNSGSSAGPRSGSPSQQSTATGNHYKIMVIGPVTSGAGVQTPPQPELVVGAKAAVKAVNAAGGVDGHPLDLQVCDTQGAQNGGVTCATKAVQQKVLAVVGAVDFFGDYISVLKSGGVPNVGPLPIQAELTDTNSYPIEGGASVVPAAVVSYAAKQGLNSVAYVGNSSAYTSAIPQIAKPVIDKHAGFQLHLISIPAAAVDVSPYVAQAKRDKLVDLATFSPTATLSFIKDYIAGGGSPGSIVTSASTLTPALIKSLGTKAEGLKISSLFIPAADSTPAAQQFSKDMDAVNSSAAKDEVAENSYLAVKLFAAAAKGHQPKDGTDVASEVAALTNLDLGLIPPLSFNKAVAGSPAPRVFNDGVLLAEVKNGVVVSGGHPFFSAYTGEDIAG